jgi:hypothetical protein
MDWLVRFIQIACWIEIISMHVNAQQALSLKPFTDRTGRTGNQINAALIFARSNLVNVL